MGIKNKRLIVGDLVSARKESGSALGIVIRTSSNLRYVAVRWFIDWKVSSHCRVRDLKLISRSYGP
jgi:hypothetical protein